MGSSRLSKASSVRSVSMSSSSNGFARSPTNIFSLIWLAANDDIVTPPYAGFGQNIEVMAVAVVTLPADIEDFHANPAHVVAFVDFGGHSVSFTQMFSNFLYASMYVSRLAELYVTS